MDHAGRKPLGRIVAVGLLLALLGVVSTALTRCTMVGDGLTGVKLNRLLVTTCGKQCSDEKNLALNAEKKQFEANKEICKQTYPPGDPGRQPCLAAEDARHTAAVAAIQQAYDDCQGRCHRQGTGSAG